MASQQLSFTDYKQTTAKKRAKSERAQPGPGDETILRSPVILSRHAQSEPAVWYLRGSFRRTDATDTAVTTPLYASF